MTDPSDDPHDFNGRFASLEESNLRLSSDVRALTATLQIVNTIAIEQREQNKRAAATDVKLSTIQVETDRRYKRIRQATGTGVLILAVLLPMVSILVYASLIQHVNALLAAQNKSSYSNCMLRNSAAIENADREDQLAKVETNPTIVRIHSQSAIKLRAALIDCEKYRPKKTS